MAIMKSDAAKQPAWATKENHNPSRRCLFPGVINREICLSPHRRTSLKRLLSTQHLVRGSEITKVTKPFKESWFRFAGICQRIVGAAKFNENSSKKCVHYIYGTTEASKKFPVCLPKDPKKALPATSICLR